RRSKRKKGLVQSITAGSEHFWPSSEFHVRVKEINTAIHELPQVLKTVSVLYLEGYKYHEIAKVLNEPIGTIKSRIHFAKKMLQNKIDR
ncbi:MAG: sigma factor-like helix-turn-helix DNA-binding protein, partial [Flavisolibacter sp.]